MSERNLDSQTTEDRDAVTGRLEFAAAALGLAGHQVTDPQLRRIIEQAARHEITTDEAITGIRQFVQGD